jgi:hypothetical protein
VKLLWQLDEDWVKRHFAMPKKNNVSKHVCLDPIKMAEKTLEEEIIDLNHRSQYYYFSFSPVAQPVEQAAVNRWVGGSSPSRGAKFITQRLLNGKRAKDRKISLASSTVRSG